MWKVYVMPLAHALEDNVPDARGLDPDRGTNATPGPFSWLVFGGTGYRCFGAACANIATALPLRILLRDRDITVFDASCERIRCRGVALAPSRRSRIRVRRRRSLRRVHVGRGDLSRRADDVHGAALTDRTGRSSVPRTHVYAVGTVACTDQSGRSIVKQR